MAHFANPSIGLTMEIDDLGQLEIISRELVPAIKGAMSLSQFKYQGEILAYLVALTEEADASGLPALLLRALARHSYAAHGGMISRNGLHYYLTCLGPGEDAGKNALVESIRRAYDSAEFSAPVAPELGTVDFKALTLDGRVLGNEVFASKAYTVIHLWATTCRSCLEILPSLVRWEQELPENVQVFYLTAEKQGIASLDRAVLDQKIAEFGADPDHVLLYETGFSRMIDIVLSATPTTFFVNTEGTITGDVLLGSDENACRRILKELLESR